jgi:hypothetical protein
VSRHGRPLFLDGSLVQGLELGLQAGSSLSTLTADEMVHEIRALQESETIIRRFWRVGEIIQIEGRTGTEQLANLVMVHNELH